VVGAECAIGSIRPDDRHIGYAVANLKGAHAIAELIDLPDDVVAEHERRLKMHRLWIEMPPDHDIGVHHAGREHADPYLAAAGRRQGSVDNLQLVGTAEAPDLNNPVARLRHRRIPCTHDPAHEQENFRVRFADRHLTGRWYGLSIAWKTGHVIEEDQCVNTAFLMRGFAI
jgi:hypothetical protein